MRMACSFATATAALLLALASAGMTAHAGESLMWYAVHLSPSTGTIVASSNGGGFFTTTAGMVSTASGTSTWGAVTGSHCQVAGYASEDAAVIAVPASQATAAPGDLWVVEQAVDAPHAVGQAHAWQVWDTKLSAAGVPLAAIAEALQPLAETLASACVE